MSDHVWSLETGPPLISDKDIASLRQVLDNWAKPPAELIGKLPKAGIQLDYLGHAEVTRALIEIDPTWEWEPFALDERGLPAIDMSQKMATMWIRLTVLGVTRIGVGSCLAGKEDVLKELVSDSLRNGAMRFGIALSLWSKQEWQEVEATPVPTWPMRTVKGGVVAEIEKQLKIPHEAAVELAGKAWDELYDGDRINWPVDEAQAFISACVDLAARLDGMDTAVGGDQ